MLQLSRVGRAAATFTRPSLLRHTAVIATASGRWAATPSCHERTVQCFTRTAHHLQLAVSDDTDHNADFQDRFTGSQDDAAEFARSLPVVCSGCGALSQTVERDAPGFYSQRKRKSKAQDKQHEDAIYEKAMARLSAAEDGYPFSEMPTDEDFSTTESSPIICDRCHDLIHQSTGTSILHPSMQSIQAIIESSPHRHNHIYHVLDAADFPLSLIPNLISALKLPRLRTQNRRSKTKQYIKGREADVSFIITRADLLAPRKEQVDRMMPYLQEVLRDALGRGGKNVRLGNVRCVSAKRGWWTPSVKQDIWDRGGAGWVVGKVNVGKSALFEVVYPKGRNGKNEINVKALREAANKATDESAPLQLEPSGVDPTRLAMTEPRDILLDDMNSALIEDHDSSTDAAHIESAAQQNDHEEIVNEEDAEEDEDDAFLLPPAQPETQFPHMPIVSALPGTTASPIRIPYGNGKGELIDLPGVMRSSMETHVKPEHHSSLVMKARVVPEQFVLKPGQSLLLGGIVRITPKTEDLVFLSYPFTPLSAHATGTRKAIAIQTGVHEDGTPYTGTVENIATEKAKGRIKSAGTFKLDWDVTKKRAGPVTDKAAGKQKVENLPFKVYGADILVEGIGWVEIACQVRNKKSGPSDAFGSQFDDGPARQPEVEVFTPKGKFIGIRSPMNAWLQSGPKKIAKHAQRKRPRMSISMQRRKEGGRSGHGVAYAVPD